MVEGGCAFQQKKMLNYQIGTVGHGFCLVFRSVVDALRVNRCKRSETILTATGITYLIVIISLLLHFFSFADSFLL